MHWLVHSLGAYLLHRYTHSYTQAVLWGQTKKWRSALLYSENHVIVIQGLRLVRQKESWKTQKPGAALGLRAGRGGGGEGGGGRRPLACPPRRLQSCRPPCPHGQEQGHPPHMAELPRAAGLFLAGLSCRWVQRHRGSAHSPCPLQILMCNPRCD